MRRLLIGMVCLTSTSNLINAQTSVVAPIYFNVEKDHKITNDNGLSVGFTMISWHRVITKLATLDNAPARTEEKGVFELAITIQNNGSNDIAIYDWGFDIICPQNNMGVEWNATSTRKLMTAYIPSHIFI